MKNYLIPLATFLLGIASTFGMIQFMGRSSPAPIIINPPAPTETPGPINVYINGEINDPGVYEMPLGSRLEALLKEAGGVTDEADEDSINLAALLTDGAQLFIVSKEANEEDTAAQSTSASERSIISTSNTSTTTNSDTLININTADRAQLEEIPGVGEATAGKIIAYREDNGPFLSIEDIMNVSGIGEAKFDAMRNIITIER